MRADEGACGEDEGEPAPRGLDRVEAEISQAEPLLEQEVVGFGLPTDGVVAQNGLRAQAGVASDEVGSVRLTRVAFGEYDAH